jgi:hypothetical protein
MPGQVPWPLNTARASDPADAHQSRGQPSQCAAASLVATQRGSGRPWAGSRV